LLALPAYPSHAIELLAQVRRSNAREFRPSCIIDSPPRFLLLALACAVSELRDQRLRRHYGTRYDYRANITDWDYNTRVRPSAGNIHPRVFRRWRLSGVAFEFGDETYTQPNRSIGSWAHGRERGLSKVVRGFWGDVVVSPYHAFGTHATDVREGVAGTAAARRLRMLFDVTARHMGSEQYRHTCEEISVHNILAILHEIETGDLYLMRKDHDVYSGVDEGRRIARLRRKAKDLDKGDGDKDSSEPPPGDDDASKSKPKDTEPSTDASQATVSASAAAQARAKYDRARAEAVRRMRTIVRSLQGIKIVPLLGSLPEFARRKRYAGLFDLVCLSGRSGHEMKHDDFAKILADDAIVSIETARNAVILNEEQAEEYERRIASMAAGLGCVLAGTDQDLCDDRFGVGSLVEVKGGKKQREREAKRAAMKLSKAEKQKLESSLGDHAKLMLYLRESSVWDSKQGDHPKPQRLFFRFDRSMAEKRRETIKSLLDALEPMRLLTPEEAE